MKIRLSECAVAGLIALSVALGAMAPVYGTLYAADSEWITLFNGTNLFGWKGDTGIWRVEEGCIVGKGACTDHVGYKSYLKNTSQIFTNFILEADFNMSSGNSGINYHCQEYRQETNKLYETSGYQADISSVDLYDIYTTSTAKRYFIKKAICKPAQLNQWHTLRIEVNGNSMTHSLDGTNCLEFVDNDTNGGFRKKGFVALEFHDNKTTIKFRNIRVKTLPSTPCAATAITRVAEKVASVRGKDKEGLRWGSVY